MKDLQADPARPDMAKEGTETMDIITILALLLAASLAGNVWLAWPVPNVRRACRALTPGR